MDDIKEVARRVRRGSRVPDILALCDYILTLKAHPDQADPNKEAMEIALKTIRETGGTVDGRKAYNDFMREYMRQWRSRKGKSK